MKPVEYLCYVSEYMAPPAGGTLQSKAHWLLLAAVRTSISTASYFRTDWYTSNGSQHGVEHLGQYLPGNTHCSTPRFSQFGHLTPGILSSLQVSKCACLGIDTVNLFKNTGIGSCTALTGKRVWGAPWVSRKKMGMLDPRVGMGKDPTSWSSSEFGAKDILYVLEEGWFLLKVGRCCNAKSCSYLKVDGLML